ncbi:MAG TPA: hypothetical protein VN256_16505 [Pyrinomonadaceae bacterium]|nr:hypothetical protein [Pyrinomonadaceae bacterium]
MGPKSNSRDSERTSRRRFAKSMAATLIAAPLASRLADAQTPARPKEPTAPPATTQPTPAPQGLSPVAAAYAEVARARFGDKLSPEQLEQTRKDLNSYVTASERLRAVKLKNSDEPDFVFSPD